MAMYPYIAPQTDRWQVTQDVFSPDYLAKFETILAQGNGYLGQRGALEESYVGQTRNLFVAGTFDRFHESEVCELPNLPDLTNIEIFIRDRRFSMVEGSLLSFHRCLDLRTGELRREIRWQSNEGEILNLRWRRIVSMENEHLLAAVLEITPEQTVDLSVLSGIDARMTNSGTQHVIEGDCRVLNGDELYLPAQLLQAQAQVVLRARHQISLSDGAQPPAMRIVNSRRFLAGKYSMTLSAGQTLRVEKLCTVHTARDNAFRELSLEEANRQVLLESKNVFDTVKKRSYDAVFAESAAHWECFWLAQDIPIECDNPFEQLAIRFAIYHLNIMYNPRDNRVGIAAKGLTGEGYKGHSFWDTEIFAFPYYLLTQPHAARTLLEYRHHILPDAKEKARKYGFQGAMYPWESACVTHGEVTPDNLGVDLVTGETVPCLVGEIELHVTADIAYAVWQYYSATGDDAFMHDYGNRILLETALYWTQCLKWSEENARYELPHVIGPDEYQVDVDNNAYTNYMAALNLHLAQEVLARNPAALRENDMPDNLEERIAYCLAHLYLPVGENGIIEQFDGYFQKKRIDLTKYKQAPRVGEILKDISFEGLCDYQAAKQADVVLLMYLMEDRFPPEQRRSNYHFYESRTLHDSSLSRAIHSVVASDLGLAQEAHRMFMKAAETDLGPEPDSCDAGIHSANMGGIWQCVVMGFGGARICQGRLRIAPHLPEHWRSLRYRICWQGSILTVTLRQDQIAIRNDGAAVQLLLGDMPVLLAEHSQKKWRQEEVHAYVPA